MQPRPSLNVVSDLITNALRSQLTTCDDLKIDVWGLSEWGHTNIF